MRIGGFLLPAAIACSLAACNPPVEEADAIACAPSDPDQPTWVSFVWEEGVPCFASPDGRERVIVDHNQARLQSRPEIDLGRVDGGHIIWRPDSSGFGIFNADGSGQSSSFRYVDLAGEQPVTSLRLAETIETEYARRFGCSGDDWWVYQWPGEGWADDGQIRILAQGSHHNEDCRDQGGAMGVIGDPVSGAISRILTRDEVLSEWCEPVEYVEFGYCFDEAAHLRARAAGRQ